MPTIEKGDRPMTAINVFTPEDYARMRARPDAPPFLAEALTIAQFEPGFYEVTDVFAADSSDQRSDER